MKKVFIIQSKQDIDKRINEIKDHAKEWIVKYSLPGDKLVRISQPEPKSEVVKYEEFEVGR